MNICLFVDNYLPRFGGLQFAVHSLATALTDFGCQVTVMARRLKDKGKFSHNYNLIRYGYDFPLSGRSQLNNITGLLTLLSAHKKIKFDVLNCHGVDYAGIIAVMANKFMRIPLVMTPHGSDIQRIEEIGYGLRLKKKWDRTISRNLNQADAVTTISEAIKKEIGFLSSERIYEIPNGFNRKLFKTNKGKYLHELLSLDLKKKIILSVGAYRSVKGYEYGIEAFYLANKMQSCKDLVYVIIGKDTHRLKSTVQKYEMEDKIFLLPQQDRKTVIKCYQSGWCFFSPSLIEGLSLVSIEAMGVGLPLVVTDVPGNVDIVKNNDCGLIVKSKNALSMAKGIKLLVSDRKLYDNFANQALNRADFYDWSNIAKMYLNVYQSAAKKHGTIT